MTRRRRLRPDELELWNQVARSADPLHKGQKPKAEPASQPLVKPATNKAPARPDPVPRFVIGENALPKTETRAAPVSSTDRLKSDPLRMDAKAFGRLKRGKLVPEDRIDLHGMTLDRAHGALTRFILMSQGQGLRLVLVITGKGAKDDPYDPMPRPRGVLKRQVPMWLKQAPLGAVVLQVSPAHVRHGGEGALYVYLRRTR